MWGWLLLHFIRMLIQRLFNWILCLYPLSLCSPHQLQDERLWREAGDVGRGSVRFTSHHFSSVLQFRAVQFPQAVGYTCQLFLFLCLYKRLEITPVWSPPPPFCRFSPAVGEGAVWVEGEQLAPARKQNKNKCKKIRQKKLGKLIWGNNRDALFYNICSFSVVGHKRFISKN